MSVFYDAYFSVDGNDVSTSLQSIELPTGVEELDDTAMGDETRSTEAGLFTWEIPATFHYSVALMDILWPIFIAKTGVTVEVREQQASVSSTNPKYTGTAILTSCPPLGGSVGDHHVISVTFKPANGSLLTRATS